MPETPTPGQVCYEVFWHGRPQASYWHGLPTPEKQCWEAAAQAVRAMHAPVPTKTPAQAMDELRGLVGKYYAGVDVDAFMAAIRGEEAP